MKVYLVECYWNNCEGYYEDFLEDNKVLGVFQSEEKAKAFMNNYSVENASLHYDEDIVIDKDISGLKETFGKMRYTRVVHLISRGGRYESEDEYVLYISEWEVE